MTRTALFAVVLFAGCSENGINILDDKYDGSGAAIEVDPSYIDFGLLGDGDDPVVQTFTIKSVGWADLDVTGIEISGAAPGSFTILSETTAFVLAPEAEQVIEVAFAPLGAHDQLAQAVVISNGDPENYPVDLVGQGSVPELQISPDPLNFGTTYVGCAKQSEVTLTNVGTDLLVINAIMYAGDALSMSHANSFPLILEPDELATVQVEFDPMEEGDFEGELAVTSNEPMGTRTSPQEGEGKYAAAYIDSWEVPVDPPSDIIFSVDQSCSMDNDVSRLASNFSSFITQLNGYSTDWQIIVANQDNGCNNSGILTPSTPNYTGSFQSAVQGAGGSYTESLLTVTNNAVQNTDGGDCNAGFLRPEAMLHIIMVSDEPEQSSGSWGTYVNQIIAKKGNAANVRMSAIAGPVPGGCGGRADPGTGYSEAVAYTGGVFLSICSDWANSSNLAMLAEASVNQDNFELSHTPVPDSIEVYKNGGIMNSANWAYDTTSNSVTITANVPEEGDAVDVEYAGLASCD